MKNSDLLARVEKLETRNKRVEADKAWETSWQRRLTIMFVTYVTVVVYLQFVVHIRPWVNAVVPVVGYFLSTLTLSYFKKLWIEKSIKRS
jgi:hypothetical protein